MKIRIYILTLLYIFICSCNEGGKSFFIGSIKKINFNKEYFVQGEFVDVDSVGNMRIEIFPPYLITTTYGLNYYTRIYFLENLTPVGNFFYKGSGPDDFLSFQIIKKEFPFLWVQDSQAKEIKVVNISETIKEGRTVIEKKISYKEIIDPFNVFVINDTCLLIKDFDVKKGLYYLMYNPGKKIVYENEISMYNYPVPYEISSKMLVLADCVKPDEAKIVSVTGILNQIDILDIQKPHKSISVTTADHLFDYSYVKNVNENDTKEFYFSYPICSDKLIFTLFRNNKKSTGNIEIHVIDWNGNPIIKLFFKEDIRDFTIDFKEKVLYAITAIDDKIYKYNISHIFE